MKTTYLLAVILSVATAVPGQERSHPEEVTPEKDRPASAAHSFMELFSKLEQDLSLAAQKRDQAALDALIAPEFIARNANDPDQVIKRNEWEKAVLDYKPDYKLDYKLDPGGIRSLMIRAFLGNAMVSFVQKQTGAASGRDAEWFIVDLWVANRGKWQLASRFASPVPAQQH